jgi:hypothetical protein
VVPVRLLDKAVKDPSRMVRAALGGYPFLEPVHVKALLQGKDAESLSMLVANSRVNFDQDDVDAVLNLKSTSLNRLLISVRKPSLTQQQIDRLASSDDPLTRFFVAQNYGVGSVAQALTALIERGNEGDVHRAVLSFKEMPEPLVNLLLNHANPAMRRQVAMHGKFKPTAEQLEKALNDEDPQVRIGILRRRDVALSAEQINQGINHPDQNVAFWYRTRDDFKPTPEQIETALSSPDPITRRSYASMQQFVPTAEQIERGLADRDNGVRWAFMVRKDIKLTDQQLDRCTVDPSFQIRLGCVMRPEFRLTQERFESILFDSNPNILGTFTDKNRETPTLLDDYIWKALKESTTQVQVALAENRRLPMSDEQLRLGLESNKPEVRAAFCKRTSYTSRDQQTKLGRRELCPS